MNIKVLENSMINKIAAGEVVERPCSVVKELSENAIDSDASSVTVEIKDGGISYIRVTDNGCGIPKDEVKTAFLRHATSKIRTYDDLLNVLTLGFRGEALSSIASVSQLEMVTKTADSPSGVKIEIHGGQIISVSDTGTAPGTTVITRNLFFNTPARRKFLKKASAEAGMIHEFMQRLALSAPKISFRFINNNQNVFSTNGDGDLKTAIHYVYGKDVSKKLIPLDSNGGMITGFITSPDAGRGNRSCGNFFINGRFIKSAVVTSAVEDAYKNRLMSGKFPVYVINMNIAPERVDINVHPSKLEARFDNEDGIYSCLHSAVKNALEGERLVPEVTWDKSLRERKTLFVEEAPKPEKISIADLVYSRAVTADTGEKEEPIIINAKTETTKPEIKKAEPVKPEAVKTKKELFTDYKIAGQIFNTYWIAEQNETMYLIDQHAAHERVLYEEFLNKFATGDVSSQMMITPEIVRLTAVESETVKENSELLNKFGFEFEEFGQDIYLLRGLPYIFKEQSARADFFIEIVDMLSGFGANKSSIYEFKLEKIASLSCKAAVKANTPLNESGIHQLIKSLLELENPFNCPHGRPTIVSVSKYEIEKKFGRK